MDLEKRMNLLISEIESLKHETESLKCEIELLKNEIGLIIPKFIRSILDKKLNSIYLNKSENKFE